MKPIYWKILIHGFLVAIWLPAAINMLVWVYTGLNPMQVHDTRGFVLFLLAIVAFAVQMIVVSWEAEKK